MSRGAKGDQEIVWQGSGRNTPMMVVTALTVALVSGLLLLADVHVVLAALVGGVIALIGATFTQVNVVVDRRKVSAAFGPWNWPGRSFRLDGLARIGTTRIESEKEGGTAAKVGLFLPRSKGMIVRPGDVLVLESHGRPFMVSVDGASDAAAVIKHLLGAGK